MKKNFLLIAVFVCVFSFSSFAAVIQEKTLHENYYRQQMILMSLYLNGINQELGRVVPSREELSFLGTSIQEIIERIRLTKGNKVYHDEFDELIAQTSKLSKASSLKTAQEAAEGVMNSCANCHAAKAKKSTSK